MPHGINRGVRDICTDHSSQGGTHLLSHTGCQHTCSLNAHSFIGLWHSLTVQAVHSVSHCADRLSTQPALTTQKKVRNCSATRDPASIQLVSTAPPLPTCWTEQATGAAWPSGHSCCSTPHLSTPPKASEKQATYVGLQNSPELCRCSAFCTACAVLYICTMIPTQCYSDSSSKRRYRCSPSLDAAATMLQPGLHMMLRLQPMT